MLDHFDRIEQEAARDLRDAAEVANRRPRNHTPEERPEPTDAEKLARLSLRWRDFAHGLNRDGAQCKNKVRHLEYTAQFFADDEMREVIDLEIALWKARARECFANRDAARAKAEALAGHSLTWESEEEALEAVR